MFQTSNNLRTFCYKTFSGHLFSLNKFFLVTFQTFFQINIYPRLKTTTKKKQLNLMQVHGCRGYFPIAKTLHGNTVDWRYFASMQEFPRKNHKERGW